MNASSRGVSAFGAGGVPSTSRIEAALRGLAGAHDVELGAHTVDAFCEHLRAAADVLSTLPFTTAPADRADSFRYLLTMVSYAVDAVVLDARPWEPMFTAPYRVHLLDWGAASPDGVYRRAMVRDSLTYRVHGRLGNAAYLSIDFRQSPQPCAIEREEIDVDADGNFELFLGGPPRDANWWSLPAGTTGLLVRELFDDWANAQRSRLRIECLDVPTEREAGAHSSAYVAAAFDRLGEWIHRGAVEFWATRSSELAATTKNTFQADLARGDTKLPSYTHGWWELEPDEALVIELPDPGARFWGLQLASSLWHTLDYANRLTTFNHAQARSDADGVVRLVLAHRDPGVHNWLDTTGLRSGVLICRFHRATNATAPRTQVVRLPDVLDTLPHALRVDERDRRVQIAERREGVAHMLND